MMSNGGGGAKPGEAGQFGLLVYGISQRMRVGRCKRFAVL
jgi:hypothetical protein